MCVCVCVCVCVCACLGILCKLVYSYLLFSFGFCCVSLFVCLLPLLLFFVFPVVCHVVILFFFFFVCFCVVLVVNDGIYM